MAEAKERHRSTLGLLYSIQPVQNSAELSVLDDASTWVDSIGERIGDLVVEHDPDGFGELDGREGSLGDDGKDGESGRRRLDSSWRSRPRP